MLKAIDDSDSIMVGERVIHSRFSRKYSENVISVTFQEPNYVVAASDNGALIAWNADTGSEKVVIKRPILDEDGNFI